MESKFVRVSTGSVDIGYYSMVQHRVTHAVPHSVTRAVLRSVTRAVLHSVTNAVTHNPDVSFTRLIRPYLTLVMAVSAG